jgi:hypothetical protein
MTPAKRGAPPEGKMQVYLEIGEKRTFAGAIEWPGWCRSGKDEQAALQALLDYGPRYARALRGASLNFKAPGMLTELEVIERLRGGTTTDFGSPGEAPKRDADKVNQAELRRFEALLKACWREFDATGRSAKGKRLRTGPRGGGRELKQIVEHVLGAEEAYLSRLGLKFSKRAGTDADTWAESIRAAMLQGLHAGVQGQLPATGPRGGKRWSPRYFVRRAAWHVLDHAWEIEDRLE